jgi:hypothetical protein
MKTCSKCREEKEESEFNAYKNRKGQPLRSQCKKCMYRQCQKLSQKNRERARTLYAAKERNYTPLQETKICPTCGLEKETKKFLKHSGRKDGLASQCKECMNEYRISWLRAKGIIVSKGAGVNNGERRGRKLGWRKEGASSKKSSEYHKEYAMNLNQYYLRCLAKRRGFPKDIINMHPEILKIIKYTIKITRHAKQIKNQKPQ